jgi:hypothetical protein
VAPCWPIKVSFIDLEVTRQGLAQRINREIIRRLTIEGCVPPWDAMMESSLV